MSEDAATVFVVDDDASVRRSTERLLRSHGLKVESFATATDFLETARADGPSCLVLDVHLPGRSGLDLQHELARAGVRIPIIFITGRGSIPMTVRAMKAGAVEFLTKPVRSQHLLTAVQAAIERDRAAKRADDEVAPVRVRYARLTPREREVMARVVAGMVNKQIAGELALTERTVKFHRAHVMEKMQAESIAELVRMSGQLESVPARAGDSDREPG